VKIPQLFKHLGLTVRDGKIPLRKVQMMLGATYREPEWLLLTELKNVEVYPGYIDFIVSEDKKFGRIPMPESYSFARFGMYSDSNGSHLALDALVYHYALETNPRNIHYAYKIFCGGKPIASNASLRSIHEAKQEASQRAAEHIDKYLIDIG